MTLRQQSPKSTTRCPETTTPGPHRGGLRAETPLAEPTPALARFLLSAPAVHPPPTSRALRAAEPAASSNVIPLPLILLLGCAPEMEARCRAIAARARVLVRGTPMPFQRTEVAALHPLVIVVPAAVYEAAPWGFEVLAEKVGASLLMLDRDPMPSIVLEYRMMEALVFAKRLRARVTEALEGRR